MGGFTAKTLKLEVGLSASELKENGFSAEELREGTFPAVLLRPLFSTTEMRMAGFVAKEMKEVGSMRHAHGCIDGHTDSLADLRTADGLTH